MQIILGLDIGDARTGVAISDELGIAAHPLCTIQRKSRKALLGELQELIAVHKVERIVIGLPLQLDGETGAQARKVKRFAEKLEQHVNLPIIFWDESFTTFEATQILQGTKKRRKKRKQVIDQVAAVLILEGYLEELRSARGKGQVDEYECCHQ
jgi:putative Holliday junction resolvase